MSHVAACCNKVQVTHAIAGLGWQAASFSAEPVQIHGCTTTKHNQASSPALLHPALAAAHSPDQACHQYTVDLGACKLAPGTINLLTMLGHSAGLITASSPLRKQSQCWPSNVRAQAKQVLQALARICKASQRLSSCQHQPTMKGPKRVWSVELTGASTCNLTTRPQRAVATAGAARTSSQMPKSNQQLGVLKTSNPHNA